MRPSNAIFNLIVSKKIFITTVESEKDQEIQEKQNGFSQIEARGRL